MEEKQTSLKEYFHIVKRRKLAMAITFGVTMLLAILVAFGLPAKYRSTAIIAIEEQEIPDDLIRTTITSYADERIQRISQQALKSLNLSAIIDKHSLYEDDIARVPRSELIEEMREDVQMDLISADVIDPRSGRPSQATIAFSLAFDYEDPVTAQKVANELVTLYQSENVDDRIEQTEDTAEYLSELVNQHEASVLELESSLAVLKAENQGALPEFIDTNMQILQGYQRDLTVTESQLQNLQNRAVFLEAQLLQTDPHTPGSLDASVISNPKAYIELMRNELVVARAKYGPNHPDVRKLQRTIAEYEGTSGSQPSLTAIDDELSSARGELDAARARYGASHPEIARLERVVGALERDRAEAVEALLVGARVTPAERVASEVNVRAGPGTDMAVVGTLSKGQAATLVDGSNPNWFKVALDDGTQGFVSKSVTAMEGGESPDATPAAAEDVPTNPAYVQLAVNLASTRSEQQSLLARYQNLQTKIEEYQAKIAQSPLVEREYSKLLRELTDARAQLQEAKYKAAEADEALAIERSQKAQRFVLLEPPIAPITPHSPNRVALLLLGFVLALFGTLGAAAIAESLDNAIRSPAEIAAIAGGPPLAAIPVMMNRADSGKSKRKIYVLLGAAVGTVVLVAVLVHFLYRPLDVLWYALMRQLGL